MSVRAVILAAHVALASCARSVAPGGGGASADARPALTFTHWTAETELFVELPALVRGYGSPLAAHVTRLADFSALDQGRVAVVLAGGAGEERFVAERPEVAGIFRPVVRPGSAGERRLHVEITLGQTTHVHDLGAVRVYESVAAAREGIREAPEVAGRIRFLKEQQWQGDFGTEAVSERAFRPSLVVTGALRARGAGEVVVTAPFAGRLGTTDDVFPRIGAAVRAGDALVTLVPRLEASDRASLDLAATSARLDLERAAQERRRLEALQADGAIPARRVAEAAHIEQEATAALAAATRRRAQFSGIEQTRAGGVGGVRVRAPITGTLVEVDVAPGTFVESGATLFHVADLTRLWLDARIPEADVARAGQLLGAWFDAPGGPPVELGAAALVGRDGRIDPTTRTTSALFAVENRDARLALGAFVRAHLLVGDPVRALGVPADAVVDDGGQRVVYVHVEGESFERRVVRLGPSDRGLVALVSGVAAGERVVTRGAWSIKLAAAGGAVPAHGHSH